jgi:hypothetical protein
MLLNKSPRTLRLTLMVLLVLTALGFGIGSAKTAQAAPDADKTLTISTSETKISKTGGLGLNTTTITLKLSGVVSPASDTIVTVTPSGAISGVDYTTTPPDSSTITILSGSTQASFDVTTTASSGNQTLTLTITCNSCSGVTVGTPASVNIIFWDETTSVSLNQPVYSILPENGSIDVTASISQAWPEDTTVNLGYTGTASKVTPPLDFSGPNFVTIPAGQLSASFTLNALGTYNGNSKTLNVAIISVPTNVSFDSTAVNLTMEAPGFSIDTGGLDPLPIPESGDTIFTIHLKTKPTKDITVAISSSDTSVSTATTSSLIFTTANWSTPQTVTITGKNDSQCLFTSYNIRLNPSSTNPSPDPNYNSVLNTTVAANNNEYCISITAPTSTYMATGESLGFSVSITPTISQDVVVDLSYSGSATKDIDYTAPASVTILANQPSATLTLTAAAGFNAINAETANIQISKVYAPGTLDSTKATSSATLAVPAVEVDTTSMLIVKEATLSSVSFHVRLKMPPTSADVIVSPALFPTGLATITAPNSPSYLTFTTANWNSYQTITIKAKADTICGLQFYDINFTVISSDNRYKNVTHDPLQSTNAEYCANLSPTNGTIYGAGKTIPMTVSIAQPFPQDVTFGLAFSSPDGAVKGTDYLTPPTSLTILAGNLSASFNLTSSANYDGTPKTISVKLTGSATNDVNPSQDTATIGMTDAKFIITPSSGTLLVRENPTDSVSVQIKLKSQPSSSVTITIISGKPTISTITPTNILTFTTSDWAQNKTFYVQGVDDGACALYFYNVTLIASSSDKNYDTIQVAIPATNAEYCAAISPSNVTLYGPNQTSHLTVSIAQVVTEDVVVSLNYDGSAIFGTDYTVTEPSLLTIPVGQTSASFDLSTTPTFNAENKTATVQISSTTVGTVDTTKDISTIALVTPALMVDTNGASILQVYEYPTLATVPIKIKLNTQPKNGDVTVDLSTTNSTVSQLSKTQLTFTKDTWNIDQTVNVQAKNDGQCKLIKYQITLNSSSPDSKFNNLHKSVAATNAEYCTFLPTLAKDTILYSDTFNNANTWSMQSEPGAKVVQTGSEMVITHIAPVRNVRVLAPNTILSLSNGFSAVVSAQKFGVGGSDYGMIFDYVAPTELTPTYYRFLINPTTQSYRLEKLVCTTTCAKTSVSSGTSAAILTNNSTNVLRVDWTGTTISLYVNNILIKTVTAEAYSGGRLGLMVFTVADTSAAKPSDVHFSNYIVVKK